MIQASDRLCLLLCFAASLRCAGLLFAFRAGLAAINFSVLREGAMGPLGAGVILGDRLGLVGLLRWGGLFAVLILILLLCCFA